MTLFKRMKGLCETCENCKFLFCEHSKDEAGYRFCPKDEEEAKINKGDGEK